MRICYSFESALSDGVELCHKGMFATSVTEVSP